MLPNLQLTEALQIASRSGLAGPRSYFALAAYYAATVVAAALDGIGLVVLVGLLTGAFLKAPADPVSDAVMKAIAAAGIEPGAGAMLAVAAAFLAARIVLSIGLDVADSKLFAHIRLRLQTAQLAGILGASWGILRDRRAGRLTATLIEETNLVAKYMAVALRGGYFLLSASVLGAISVVVSAELAILLAVVCLPVVMLLRALFSAQSRLSVDQTRERQALGADLGERFNSLFQIKLEGSEADHLGKGLRHAPEIARLEVRIGLRLAFIASISNVLVLVALGVFYVWTLWRGIPLASALPLFAGVGIVGSKAAVQLNNLVTTLGNLARLGGSLLPVRELICLPPEPARAPVPGMVRKVELEGVTYRYSDTAGVDDVSLSVDAGHPLLLRGPSGSGKTTLANLIAGIYPPSRGVVRYVTADGESHDSRRYRARIGYVPQDVLVFHGTVRENLALESSRRGDEDLWRVLEQVGAAQFVRELGGLNAVLAEAGRSLSGGERRRLGIARALCSRPDILILDEIMNGLDAERKAEIAAVVEDLSRKIVTVAITHDALEFAGWREWRRA